LVLQYLHLTAQVQNLILQCNSFAALNLRAGRPHWSQENKQQNQMRCSWLDHLNSPGPQMGFLGTRVVASHMATAGQTKPATLWPPVDGRHKLGI
jgi:hypothetical protein